MLAQIMRPMIFSLSVVLAALLLERMLRLLDLLVNKGGPLGLVVKMVVNLVPHYLGMALPAAFFLSVLLAVSRLGGDSELEALQGCGLSLRRLVTPIFVFAVFLTIFTGFLFGVFQPYARYAYRAVLYVVTHAAWDAQLEEGAFLSGDGRLTIMAERVDGGGASLRQVFVNQDQGAGGGIATTAREGRLLRDVDGYRLQLKDGVQVKTSPADPNGKIVTFKELALTVDLDSHIAPFRERGDSEREMTLRELWHARKADSGSSVPISRLSAEMHGRMARTLTVVFLPLLALPLGLASRRQRRSHGILLAAIILIVYHHSLQFGENMVDSGKVGPFFGIWLPFLLFSSFSVWIYMQVGAKPGNNPLSSIIDWLEARRQNIRIAFGKLKFHR